MDAPLALLCSFSFFNFWFIKDFSIYLPMHTIQDEKISLYGLFYNLSKELKFPPVSGLFFIIQLESILQLRFVILNTISIFESGIPHPEQQTCILRLILIEIFLTHFCCIFRIIGVCSG